MSVIAFYLFIYLFLTCSHPDMPLIHNSSQFIPFDSPFRVLVFWCCSWSPRTTVLSLIGCVCCLWSVPTIRFERTR